MKKKIYVILIALVYSTLLFSIEKNTIEYYILGKGKPKILLISGIHGNERSGIDAIEKFKKYVPKNGGILLIPAANQKAVKDNVRTPYYMSDLNRTFFQAGNDEAYSISQEIVIIIQKYEPEIILDLHESPYRYAEGKDNSVYLGDTIICDELTMRKYDALLMELMSCGFTIIESDIKGSLSYEIPRHLKIPTITVEVSKEDKYEERMRKFEDIIKIVFKYMEID